MNQWILHRTDQWGGFVSPPGNRKSYCVNPLHARRFSSQEAAEADRCPDNEVAVPLRRYLK